MRQGYFAGRVGKDAELRHTPSGKPVLGFSLAIDTREKGEKHTLWVDVSIWGDRATALQPYITKGTAIAVSGDVGVRAYERNGEARAQLLLTAYTVTLLGGGREQDEKPVRDAAPAPAPADLDNDIPF